MSDLFRIYWLQGVKHDIFLVDYIINICVMMLVSLSKQLSLIIIYDKVIH